MPRQFTEQTLIVASHNQGKVREIRELLNAFRLDVKNAAEINLCEPDETEDTYKGNAILKARAAAMSSGLPALADDSGFELMAINKDPGLHSARWAGPDRNFNHAMEKVYNAFLASGSSDTHCRFVCALSVVWPDGHDETVEGIIDGDFVWPPRGENGFGYDPIFVLKGEDQTFGEIDPECKRRVSHRAKAFALLLERCFGQTPKRQ
jgi:XTP/dITP diphosphohydrolase